MSGVYVEAQIKAYLQASSLTPQILPVVVNTVPFLSFQTALSCSSALRDGGRTLSRDTAPAAELSPSQRITPFSEPLLCSVVGALVMIPLGQTRFKCLSITCIQLLRYENIRDTRINKAPALVKKVMITRVSWKSTSTWRTPPSINMEKAAKAHLVYDSPAIHAGLVTTPSVNIVTKVDLGESTFTHYLVAPVTEELHFIE